MGRRKKSIIQFNDHLTNFNEVFEFFFKDIDKSYSKLESDLNVRLEYISKQLNKWKRDQLVINKEFDEVYNEYRMETDTSYFKSTILSKLSSFVHRFLETLGYQKLHPRLSDIIPKDLQWTHFDGHPIEVTSVKATSSNYKVLLQEAIACGKPIKKVKRHGKNKLPVDLYCQHCQAPVDYLYLHTKNQALCKCCNLTTSIERERYPHPVDKKCPHCSYKLNHRKDRSGYSIYRCGNYKCPFYLENKKRAKAVMDKHPELNLKPDNFKLHYFYRLYNFDVELLLKHAPINPEVLKSVNQYKSITKRLNAFTQQVFLLTLAYRHNYSISKSKISSIMTELHDMRMTSQTVDNYLDLMANIMRPFVENYPYKVSQKIVADETYIKIEGKQYYLYRYFDYETNIIISQYLSDTRDTIATFNSLNKCLTSIKDTVDLKNLTLVVDGYTPYQIVANDLNNNYDEQFNITVVPLIGLKNHSVENLPYVPDKQAIERNHRNFKVAYHNSTNFRSVEAALNYCTLQQAVHNFITRFRKADRIPVKLASFSRNDGIIDRWEKLLFESIQYLNKINIAA